MEKPRRKKLPNAQMSLALSSEALQRLTLEQRQEAIEHLARLLLEAMRSEGEADDEV